MREYLGLALGLFFMLIIVSLEKVGLVKRAPLTKSQKRQLFNDIWG